MVSGTNPVYRAINFEVDGYNPRGDLFVGGGEMGRRIRSFDWQNHPLGAPETWPQSLKTTVRILLTSRYAMWMGWGPEFYFFCNDAYLPTVGIKESWVLGASARKVWEEIWSDIGPRAESVVQTGQATWDESLLLFLERRGYAEETYHTFSYSPVPDDAGAIGGMLCVVTEETERVIGERRLALLRELASGVATISSEAELCQAIGDRLETNSKDLPFALIYLFQPGGEQARLACAAGVGEGVEIAPPLITLDPEGSIWPVRELLDAKKSILVDLTAHASRPSGPWSIPPRQAVLVPLAQQGQERPAGFLVAAINPYRPFDGDYSGFVSLLAGQVAAAVSNARAYEEERKRAAALAELDRAKTAFFSNVSHEFRTPLTLMLGPLEDALQQPADALSPAVRSELEVAHRNTHRLLKLVNTLLDFSRIEAGRVQATYEPTDLSAYTAELASAFRSAIERAGMRLVVECESLPEPAWVDRDMWEKVVLNLVSNAFKHTFEGEIGVSIRPVNGAVELKVRDTGSGIPPAGLERLFERFFRVQGAKARTQEGSGIGLALVQELVKLHGGTIRAESELGKGSTFTVTIPLGSAHLPSDRLQGDRAAVSTALSPAAYVQEALRWIPETESSHPAHAPLLPATHEIEGTRHGATIRAAGARIVLADDNADMRDYVRKLLAAHYRVEIVPDGRAALAAISRERPDLVLTDVMMPGLDGFGLLQALRETPATRDVPVIMLSARAGEEARIEGLDAGADDYLVKPFSARELLARVGSALELAHVRKEASQRERDLRQEAELAQEQIKTILESIGDGFISLNSEWRYIYVNTQAERLLRITRAELMGRNVWEVFPAVVGTPLDAALQRVMRERVSLNIVHYDPDRDWWLDQRIFPAEDGGISVYFRDITEEKVAEQALRASEDRYRQLIHGLPAAVYTCDVHGRITLYNDAAVTLWGREPELYRDVWCGSLHLYREDGTRLSHEESPMAKALKNGSSDGSEPLIVERPDGSCRTVLSHPRAIRNAAGLLIGGVNMLVDITERKQIEGILKEAKEAAEAANTAKDRFLAVLSHELRTPLTPVLMTVSAMEMSHDLPPSVRDDLLMIRRNVELETKLIDDLLDLSRITSGKLRLQPQSIDLNEVVRHVAGICRPQLLEKAIRFQAELDPAVPRVNADPARLQQILWNILKNSVKFTPEGGNIFLRTSVCRSGAVQISVRDTGIGIPSETLPRVFDAFEQGEASITRQFGGLGLGLAISKALIEMHGGTIFARSEGHGKGSTFVIELPLQEALPVDRPAVPRRDSLKTAHPLRLLVVEDHLDTARVLKKLLTRSGYIVEVVSTVATALDAAANKTFDIVISDIGLPDGTGYELMKRLRENPHTLGIAMSGFGMDEDIRKSREAGFLEHLVKPLDMEQLQAALGRLKKRRGK